MLDRLLNQRESAAGLGDGRQVHAAAGASARSSAEGLGAPAFLRQRESTGETRALVQACALSGERMAVSSLPQLSQCAELLRGGCVPVGSVEFVREAMRLAGVAEPDACGYPAGLQAYWGRSMWIVCAGELAQSGAPIFIKPVTTKLFNGFVWRPDGCYASDHDVQQADAVRQLPEHELLHACEPVTFAAEWRVYLMGARVMGIARYDDGSEEVEAPPRSWLDAAAQAVAAELRWCACAVDVGRLRDGRLVIVEINDFWALGYYPDAMAASSYALLTRLRWREIVRRHGATSAPQG